MTTCIQHATFSGLTPSYRGKVRDVFTLDDQRLLMVACDRLSAFDVILPDPIPGKGEILTQLSNFWFNKTRHIIDNHLLDVALEDVLPEDTDFAAYKHRSVITKRLKPLPVEAIARGYIIGSGWKDYQAHGKLCGIPLPQGLQQADKLDSPIFTPSTKAAIGNHDENISFDQAAELIGQDLAEKVREITLKIYAFAADYAFARGIIIADTKLEFGTDDDGHLYVMDEMLTPDSSRFWPKDAYQAGISPPSFDKQYVRDYLETLDWNKQSPGPRLPQKIIDNTANKYQQALELLTGEA